MDDIFIGLLLLALVTCFISVIGFIIRWIMKKPKKKWGIVALTAFVAFWGIGLLWGVLTGSYTVDNTTSDISETSEIQLGETNSAEVVGDVIDELMPEIQAESDTFVLTLMSYGFTEEEAIENAKILMQCGIPTIVICEPVTDGTIDNLVSFRGELGEDRVFWFTVENRKIFYVSLNGEDLYDEDKGGYLKNFEEVHIPETTVSVTVADTLRNKTESVLDGYFTSSRYYDAWAYAREDNNYMVQCQATDGSLLTSNWIYCRVWYEQQGNGEFVVTGVQINGKQYKVK